MWRIRYRFAILAGLLSIVALGPAPGGVDAQAPGCDPYPAELSPKGGPGARFTMLVRINKLENVSQYAALQAERGQFRERDIFVVNTRFRGLESGEAAMIVERLRTAFPCNRIIALNGLGADPNRPGYLLALTDNPEVWGTMLDWEHQDWRAARATNPAMTSWKRHFGRSFRRLKQRVGQLANTLNRPGVGPRRAGVVPTFYHDWNYGRIAKMLDQRNRRLGHSRGGIQVVATQASCQRRKRGDEERGGIRPRAAELFRQYGKQRRKKRNLALQVSFSGDAKARRGGLPIRSVNDGRASKCIRGGLRRGAGAFLLWTSPESMTELLYTSRLRKLRPPAR